MSIPVVTVGESASECVTGLEQLRGPVTVVRRCEEFTEMIAACQTGIARAAIIAFDAGELTASLLDRLRAADVAVVALADDNDAQERLRALNIRQAGTNVEPAVLAEQVSLAVADLELHRDTGSSSSFAETADSLVPRTPAPAADPESDGDGRVIAIWGPTGAPGRTTLAVNLAAELTATGSRVLLIDADTYGASVAAALGLLDESAAVAQACRFADQGSLDSAMLMRVCSEVLIEGNALNVLTGITRPDRWAEVRPSALSRIIAVARSSADAVVVDCGFGLEADEELSFDTLAPRRNGATLRCLELADEVYAVGAADSIGVPRLVRGLNELAEAVPTAVPRVIFNKVRAASVGRSPERQLREAWERFGPASAISAFLPADFDAADAALLAGSTLCEAAPASPLRQSIASLVDAPVEQRRRGSTGAPNNEMKFSGNGVRLSQ
ncbi:MinD-like ATPase involved in chromosome partitioning or flagellar assembly [Arthrobacter pigmenti]|uniref:MinD-like ATPase involved in chromosome partitioning or flagellar assembly n=1 Tax=Arthrobacter pigmenti TaxID=271432 RepID=A0A846RRZ1_9MICC|nr:ParA family protein [Arthrobacter pigmenti]NJC22927.1 MinD-like ATPase involved in chromosome partitioning or flagellar assembly [Arthrobacter pigmenti]